MSLQDNKFKKVFISVVSHNHGQIISAIDCIRKLACEFSVVIKSNSPDDVLFEYCMKYELTLLDEAHANGFGFNNNYVFNYCVEKLGMKDEDYFVILNPDVDMEVRAMKELVRLKEIDRTDVAAINLFKDKQFTIYDCSVRKFPSLWDFILSFTAGINNTIVDKSDVKSPMQVDWCAGSFIALKVSAFKLVSGFDISYFM